MTTAPTTPAAPSLDPRVQHALQTFKEEARAERLLERKQQAHNAAVVAIGSREDFAVFAAITNEWIREDEARIAQGLRPVAR
jgi:hypothetical protein